jgi:hypothetical protein
MSELKWPEGLTHATIRLVVDEDLFEEHAYQHAFQGLQQVVRGPNSRNDVSLVDRVDRPTVIARFSIRKMPEQARGVTIHLSEARSLTQRLSTFDELPNVFAAAFPRGVGDAYISVHGRFTLPARNWTSLISLPIVLPSGGEAGRGAPEISGLEFTFRDDASSVRFASLSRYDDVFEAYMQANLTFDPADSLVARGLATLHQQLQFLVMPTATTTPTVNP